MVTRRDENLQTVIIILASISFILAEFVIYFVAGQVNLIVSNLFYIPIIILAFRYPKIGGIFDDTFFVSARVPVKWRSNISRDSAKARFISSTWAKIVLDDEN